MTRNITCDVCDKADDISQADLYFVLQIPHVNLEGDEPITEDPLIVDVCSVECMHTVVDSLDRDRVPVSPSSAREVDLGEVAVPGLDEGTFETVPGPNGTFVPIPVANYRPAAARIGGGDSIPPQARPRNRLQPGDLDDFYTPGPHVYQEGEVTVDGKRERPQ